MSCFLITYNYLILLIINIASIIINKIEIVVLIIIKNYIFLLKGSKYFEIKES